MINTSLNIKISVLSIVFSTICFVAFAQPSAEPVHYFKELFPANGVFTRPDSLSDGKWIAYLKDNQSQIGLIINYKKGKRNGESLTFWPNGKLRTKEFYINGNDRGDNERWYKTGVKQSQNESFRVDALPLYFYRCKKLNLWTIDGIQVMRNGSGKFISYYDEGPIIVEGNYLNGLRTGEWKWFYKAGKIERTSHFKKGRENGSYVTYHLNGKIKETGQNLRGKRSGKWQDRDLNGSVIYECSYKNGEYSGKVICWYANGNLFYDIEYKKGKQDGEDTDWYENGKVKSKTNFRNDMKEGESTQWYENGNVHWKGVFKSGRRDGEWLFWNKDGLLDEKIKYRNGAIIN